MIALVRAAAFALASVLFGLATATSAPAVALELSPPTYGYEPSTTLRNWR